MNGLVLLAREVDGNRFGIGAQFFRGLFFSHDEGRCTLCYSPKPSNRQYDLYIVEPYVEVLRERSPSV